MSDDEQSTVTVQDLRDFAHEIRTPLNALLSYTHLIGTGLEAEIVNREVLQDYNATVNKATIQLLRICERVLDAAVSGDRPANVQSVNVLKAVFDVVKTFEAQAKQSGVSLDSNIDTRLPDIMVDPVLFTEILTNIVSNALKYTPRGGSVTLESHYDADEKVTLLAISDTGSGIPDDMMAKIQRGQTVSVTKEPGQHGWGRGLRIVRALCAQQGIALDFVSEEGRGTIVKLQIPANA